MTILVEAQCMSIVLPAARCDLGITIYEQGLLNSVSFLGLILSSHFWGFMVDVWGRLKTLKLALSMCFFCSALSSLAVASWMLLLCRFLVGIWYNFYTIFF